MFSAQTVNVHIFQPDQCVEAVHLLGLGSCSFFNASLYSLFG